MPDDDAIPTKREVERQLERMLKSGVFAARPQQAKVFELIVKSAIAGREIAEKDIRAKFFPTPPYNPDSTVVRTTVNFIRGRLVRDYYAEEGEDDPVIVNLPRPGKPLKRAPGTAYVPEFSYNPRSRADHAYREGMRCFENIVTDSDFFGAGRFFSRAIAALPSFAPAYAAHAEFSAMKPMLAPYMRPLTLLARAGMDARKALKRDPRLWRAHVALAVVHVCRREWNPAREEFDKALRINAAETRYHPWYAAFLMAIGKTKEALILVADRAEERPEDPFAHAIWGLFAYVARDFDTARLLLDEALSKNPDNWVACFASACVRLHSGDTDGVGERLVMRAHEQLHTEVFPGLYVLCLRTPTVRDKQSLDQELNSIAAHVQTSEYWSPLQTALGQMAFNEKEAALESLAEAFNDCTPYMAWMHLWPFLDPLRGEKKFQRLVGRMRLPASK